MKSALFHALLAGGLALSHRSLAEEFTFAIDPEKSSVTASGTAAGYPIQQQGPGSLTTKIAGNIVAEIHANTISFKETSTLDPLINGDWQPLPNGQAGAAPADFAGQAVVVLFNVKAAFRNVLLNISSFDAPLAQDQTFDVSQVRFFFPANSTSTFDYDAAIFGQGSRTLANVESNEMQGTGSITQDGSVQTITIPFQGTFLFDAIEPDDSELTLTGQIVATRTVSIPTKINSISVENKTINISFSSSPGAELELQSSPDLKTWSAVTAGITTVSPGVFHYTAPTEGPLLFFRVVRK